MTHGQHAYNQQTFPWKLLVRLQSAWRQPTESGSDVANGWPESLARNININININITILFYNEPCFNDKQ
jgi:hypothetical protein